MKLELGYFFLLIIPSCLSACGVELDYDNFDVADTSLLDFLINTQDLTQRDPEIVRKCFDDYWKLVEINNAKYKEGYEACLKTAEKAIEEVHELSEEERKDIEAIADKSCAALSECSKRLDALEFYECYRDASDENIKLLTKLSVDATETVIVKNKTLDDIDYEKNACIRLNQRRYDEERTTTEADLKDCLAGKNPTTTPTPTTSEDPTTTSEEPPTPSVDPSSTSEEPSTPSVDPSSTSEEPPTPSVDPSSTSEEPPTPSEDTSTTSENTSEPLPEEDLSEVMNANLGTKIMKLRKSSRAN